jgi:hypothetical protein
LVLGVFSFTVSILSATTYNCNAFGPPAGPPTGINNSGTVVGNATGGHGYIRDSSGNISLVDYPGAASTQLFAINNNGLITGAFGDPHGVAGTFGYFTLDQSGNFKVIHFPPPYDQDVYIKSIYGINDAGAISASSAHLGMTEFFILNPDGSVTPVPSGAKMTTPGSLNKTLQFLETNTDPNLPSTSLAGPDGAVIPILWVYPAGHGSVAVGLNNEGTTTGYTGLAPALPHAPPTSAFTRDKNGIFSDFVCPALSGQLKPRAINDAGVIAGNSGGTNFIATPIPGNAQFHASEESLDFGTVVFGQPTAPLHFAIANMGNARLDLGSIRMLGYSTCCTPPDVLVSPCLDKGVTVVSLNPGASCTATVSLALKPSRTGTITDQVIIDDSGPGAPHFIPVSVKYRRGGTR